MHDGVVELRPGVFRPDWSAATTPAAQEALGGRAATRPGFLEKWMHPLPPDADTVWRVILRLYADLGRPPLVAEISTAAELPELRVTQLLRQLQERDVLGLNPEGDTIQHAYPFTEGNTGHHIALGAHVLNALCAIDALGAGAMCGTDTAIQSSCRACGKGIRINTAKSGRVVAQISPPGSVVWHDYAYAGSAAASCCPTIAFFCSDEHLDRWLNTQNPRRSGMRLSVIEALEVGRAVFGPVLQPPRPIVDDQRSR